MKNPFKAMQEHLIEQAFNAAEAYLEKADFDKNGEADIDQLKRVLAEVKLAVTKFLASVDFNKVMEALKLVKNIVTLIESAVDKGKAAEVIIHLEAIKSDVAGYIGGVQQEA